MNPKYNEARKLLAGALADFLLFLAELPNPIIVGGEYPRNKLVDSFKQWTKECNFSINDADINAWKTACIQGYFK